MKPRDLVIPDVESALRYLVGRAEFKAGEWQKVRSGKKGELRLAWRLFEGHQLAVSMDDRVPGTADLYEVRKALARANLEERGIEEHPERNTVILRLQVAQREIAL
jgi:hypothetical protein